MVNLLRILAIALITVFAHLLVKQTKPEIAMIITIAGSVLIITLAMDSIKNIVISFYNIFQSTGVNANLLSPLFKIIAIGYIAEFGANICIDAGATSIADKVLFVAKITILMIAVPIITQVIEMVVALL